MSNEIPKEEFEQAYNLFPKGDLNRVFTQAQYYHYKDKIPYELMLTKWREYIESCQKAKTDEQYITSFERFIEKQMYNSNFKVTLQLGFLNKYKKK
jgi:hypothetical protein